MSCIYRNIYFESDEFYQICLHSLSCVQVPLHILGTYIIWMKTPKTMGRVKGSMMTLHLFTAWMDIFLTVVTAPIILFPIVSGYSLGVMTHLNISVWPMLYAAYFSYFGLFTSVMLFFENRYNYLVRTDSESPSRKVKRTMNFVINYIIAISSVFIMFSNRQDAPGTRNIDHQTIPCLPIEYFDKPNFFKMSVNPSIWFPTILTYAFIIWTQTIFYFGGTSRYLYRTKAQSSRTSQMQKKFFKTLCIQISLPFLSIMIPGLYYLYTYLTPSFDMFLALIGMIVMSTHGLTSTLIMLFAHKPYREATLELFGLKKKNVAVPFIVAKPSISNFK